MSDKPYRFLLRMPEDLRAELREAAGRNGRSLNSEIVARLEAAGEQPDAARRSRHVRLGALAVATTLALTAGSATLVRAGAQQKSPFGSATATGSARTGGLGWVREGNFDPDRRAVGSRNPMATAR